MANNIALAYDTLTCDSRHDVALHCQGTLSLNAAIFAAVLLASRLESNEKVFGLVLFALELFAFFPLARWGQRGVHRYRGCVFDASCFFCASCVFA